MVMKLNQVKYLCGAIAFAFVSMLTVTAQEKKVPTPTPQYRPAFHFTPQANWMNDPNGLVFYRGVYHQFFQYYPHAMVWGPMHWGHATSKDLIHWEEQSIALYPDDLGMIFSGSVVVDEHNTSGFGKNGQVPLVAIFTHHNDPQEKTGSITFQSQSLAYSLDEGKTWTKYPNNPVLKNPGIRDYRDPKVAWHAQTQKWIMSLATADRITFYSSNDLKDWKKESAFGDGYGAHDGIWECPDLFPLQLRGKTRWVLLVSLVAGGPNGGSATQYFVGDFDGHQFVPENKTIKWIDFGPDNYAGVTWANTGDRRLFTGWMSNWNYATVTPTAPWRSAMTVTRELSLQRIGDETYLRSVPVRELSQSSKAISLKSNMAEKERDISEAVRQADGKFLLHLQAAKLASFELDLTNTIGDRLVLGYDTAKKQYFIDRSNAGLKDFSDKYTGHHYVPRISLVNSADIQLLFDASSVEIFADGGLSVMTAQFFKRAPWDSMRLKTNEKWPLKSLNYRTLNFKTPR